MHKSDKCCSFVYAASITISHSVIRQNLLGNRKWYPEQSISKIKYTDTSIRNVTLPHRLRKLTCHMGSQSDTYHPADVTFPPLPQPKLVLDLARDAWLSWPRHCSKGVCKTRHFWRSSVLMAVVCPSVRLLVQNKSKKVIDRLSWNLEGYVENETKKRWLNLEMIRNLFGES